LTWLVWRQHRNQAYLAGAAIAVFAVLFVITGRQMSSQYQVALRSCTASHTCGTLARTLNLGSPELTLLVNLTLLVPCLLGAFWGGPLVGRELETGTTQFVWMQSTTRRRWLAAKIGWVLLAAAAGAGAISAIVTWWSSPVNALNHGRFQPGQFDVQGIVPVGYALFAVALGIATGAVLRRTLPALAITIGVYAALRIVIAEFLRPHFMAAVTKTSGLLNPFEPAGSYLLVERGVTGSAGHDRSYSMIINNQVFNNVPAACRTPGVPPPRTLSCLAAHGFHEWIRYQPAGRYWTFQGIETGVFVILAAALIACTAVVVVRRDV
jgi:ABC-type transport system involved in multi-copper enzyme maturation permease subunit